MKIPDAVDQTASGIFQRKREVRKMKKYESSFYALIIAQGY